MTQGTQNVSKGRQGARPSEAPSGWMAFASVMMMGLGTFALVAAIADLVNSSWVMDGTIFGATLDWFWYGFFDLIVAIGSYYAAYAILKRRVAGYVIGLFFATLSAGRWFLLMFKAPLWSIAMLVVWGLVVYALTRSD